MAVLFSFATLTFIRIGNLKNLNSSNKGNLFTAIDSSCFVFHLNHNLNINIAHKASTHRCLGINLHSLATDEIC